MKNLMWCIACGSWELVHGLRSNIGPFHAKIMGHIGEPLEIDACEGPFVMSEPPIMSDEEWELTFRNEPDADELVQIDANNEHLVEW